MDMVDAGNMDAGMVALRWLMHEHTRIPASLQALCLNLIHSKNYVRVFKPLA